MTATQSCFTAVSRYVSRQHLRTYCRAKGIFPNTAELLRLSACVVIEAPTTNGKKADRRYLSEEPMTLLNPSAKTPREKIATTATP